MPGGGELFGERNRGVAPPDHRPVGGRVARAEVEVVVRTEARGVVSCETEAGIPASQLLAAGDERGVAESFGAAAVERFAQQSAGQQTGKDNETLYHYFCAALDRALTDTAQTIDGDAQRGDLARMALDLALRSYAAQLACARILDILQPEQPEPGHKSKK